MATDLIQSSPPTNTTQSQTSLAQSATPNMLMNKGKLDTIENEFAALNSINNVNMTPIQKKSLAMIQKPKND